MTVATATSTPRYQILAASTLFFLLYTFASLLTSSLRMTSMSPTMVPSTTIPTTFLPSSCYPSLSPNSIGIITTIAGTGVYGYSGDNGQATLAKFTYVSGVCVDAAGNQLCTYLLFIY